VRSTTDAALLRNPDADGTALPMARGRRGDRTRGKGGVVMSVTNNAAAIRGLKQIGYFALHFAEMCAPMCIGFTVADLLYFWLASLAGYSEPFRELPELSVLVVTVSMTAPMTAWMLYRGMPHRAITEMSAAMPIVAIVLVGLGWVGLLSKENLALLEHGLMMPAMLIPMFLRLDLYTSRAGHTMHTRRAASQR
jgi:hypothetical protein